MGSTSKSSSTSDSLANLIPPCFLVFGTFGSTLLIIESIKWIAGKNAVINIENGKSIHGAKQN